MHRCLCIEREPFQGYSTQLISVCWELCDYVFSSSLSLCLSLFCVCVCFLRARSGMSVENRLFKVGLPCTLSRGRDGPSKIFLPLANTLVVTFFIFFLPYFLSPFSLFIWSPVCIPISTCSSDRGSIGKQQGLEKVHCHWRHHSTEAILWKHTDKHTDMYFIMENIIGFFSCRRVNHKHQIKRVSRRALSYFLIW